MNHQTIDTATRAFPVHPIAHERSDDECNALSGMSLRDYFAAKVITGLFSDRQACVFSHKDIETFAECAYEIADAMMKARTL